MTDKAKRHSLKMMAAAGAGAVALATSAGTVARQLLPGKDVMSKTSNGAEIQLHSRISSQTNDLEIVVTNVSWAPTQVLEFSTGKINTRRGSFDLNALLENGPLEIGAGKSVVVPMKRHVVVLDGTGLNDRLVSLASSMSDMRVVTNAALA